MSGRGLLMIVLGLWLLMRTVNQDSSGRTLIDHILGRKPATTGLESPVQKAAQKALTSPTPFGQLNQAGNFGFGLGLNIGHWLGIG